MSRQETKNKSLTFLLIAVVIVIAVNYLSGFTFFRLDLTTEKRFTLADATKKTYSSLDKDITVKLFLSGELNVGFTKLAKSTTELIDELAIISSNRIIYNTIDPNSFAPKERKEFLEKMAKINLMPIPVFETAEDGSKKQSFVFPYAILNYDNKEIPINLLENVSGFSGSENLNMSMETLEYKFTDALRKAKMAEKPKIAFLEGHGELDELDVMDITHTLSEYYNIERGQLGADISMLDPYKLLIIAKPQQKFTDSEKYIIDQYLMKGGKLLVLADAVNVTLDSLRQSPRTVAMVNELNFEDQLFTYGVRINPLLIQDAQAALLPVNVAPEGQNPKFVPAPWYFSPLVSPTNHHVISKRLSVVKTEFCSYVDTVGEDLKLKRSFLLRSSKYTKKVVVPTFVSLAMITEKPDKASFNNSYLPIAVVEEGIFPSLFQNRSIPQGVDNKGNKKLKESVPTKIVVVADGDIIKNEVRHKATQPDIIDLGYDELTKQTYGNKQFILNAVNYLCDDEGWMELSNRTFTLRLLDKAKLDEDKTMWKIINLVAPTLFIVVGGLLFIFIRRRKYRQKLK